MIAARQRARERGDQTGTNMRWTAALALALAAHAAVVATIWLSARLLPARGGSGSGSGSGSISPTAPIEFVVELEHRRPPARAAPPPAERRPAPRSSAPTVPARPRKQAHARVESALQLQRRAGSKSPSDSPPPPPSSSPPVQMLAPSATRLPSGPPPTLPPAAAPPPPPGVDLRLRRDPIASEALPSAEARPGQVIETPTVSGTVQADGSLAIRDKASVHLDSDITSPRAGIKHWLDDPRKHAAERDGTVQIIRGTFDVTDSIMRALGQDPYRAEKMKMLDATREQRLALAARADAERQRQALAGLPAMLRKIWGDAARPMKERRRLLFELWDECQETAEGDVAGTSAGARARQAIILFIRTAARPGTPDAYSTEELLALNRTRQSRQRFAPYF
jgi:hypothetical protein